MKAAYLMLAVLPAAVAAPSVLIPYRETGAEQSPVYKVAVNGRPVFVARHFDMSYAHFAFAGTAEVRIEAAHDLAGYTLSPRSARLGERRDGRAVTFTLTFPRKVLFWHPQGVIDQIAAEGENRNEAQLKQPKLAIFADPLEDNAPRLATPGVLNIADHGNDLQRAVDAAATLPRGGTVYVSAGKFGGAKLKSNVAIYLAPGAVLTGRLSAENVENIRVYGRGVLNSGAGPAFRAEYCKNVLLEDFVTIDSGTPVLYGLNARVSNLKNMRLSRRNQTLDGNGTTHLTIDNVFFWSCDDAAAIGYRHDQEDVNVRNSVFGTWMTGAPFKVAGSFRPGQSEPLYKSISTYTYENNDCLIGERFASVREDCGGDVENFVFKNIRFENHLHDMILDVGYATHTPQRNAMGYGQMRNFYFQDIDSIPAGVIALMGLNEQHPLTNVTFDSFRMGGRLLTDPAQILRKQHLVNLRFLQHEPVAVEVAAGTLYASRNREGQFTISRTGPTSAPLTVRYTVRGTARMGTDYEAIPAAVTIPAGRASATIRVRPKGSTKELKTVLLSLENERHETRWSLGPKYQAVVNIVAGDEAF